MSGRRRAASLPCRRLDVNQDVSETWIARLDRAFHFMRDMVPFADGDIPIYADVKIDIKAKTHLAYETFFHLAHARHRGGRIANKIDNFASRGGVHDLVQSWFQQPVAVGGDNGAGEKRRPIVGPQPWFTPNEGNRNPRESCDRDQRVNAMMPGIGLDGSALDVTSKMNDVTVPAFFYQNRCDENDKGKGCWRMMREEQLAHTLGG